MRQQSFQKALSKMTETGFRLFFVASLLFAGLTACYNRWLCLAELVLVLILYLYFQTGITRRKKEVMVYLDHMTSGVDAASRRTMITSPLPIVIFRPDTDDIIWSNERFLHLTGDPDHLFETKLSALVPSFQSQWLLDGDHLAPEPIPVGEKQYLVYGNLVCTGDEDAFLATTYWVDVTEYAGIADRFHFPGFMKGKQVYEVYKNSDVFVMPSVSEPFGIAPLEAMQCGTPSIISKQSGCGEILDKVIKTDYWDIHAMADAIYSLCTNPALFQYLQEEGRKEVDGITWEKWLENPRPLRGCVKKLW